MTAVADRDHLAIVKDRTNRILHLADILQWDVRNWSTAVRFWEVHTSIDLSNCCGLEIGSHQGGLSLWMALHGARVVCSDLNGTTREAERLHREHRVSRLIEYEPIDATNIPYEDHFDIIFLSRYWAASD